VVGFGLIAIAAWGSTCITNPACNSGSSIIIKKIADIFWQARTQTPTENKPLADEDYRRGPSGEPKRHQVDLPTKKAAKDAARNAPRANQSPQEDGDHFHSIRNGRRTLPNVHYGFPS
jgi:hypothetical protein